ncbi:hypothetical protein RFI_24745 [Reticulomyxa filosa]|uniref:DEPDC5 C-terminal domain-containing protein n=1 Tax=Reticulomyxa filosa TaxID=46433 RepID=X6MFE9_RETFI|nr:hypothetical protein RFI_24745 [Reticulomyxa filosa]|eukprot:ETO12629.1 hypothetical protein RFI_24745 [Reticulomyxa filosa]
MLLRNKKKKEIEKLLTINNWNETKAFQCRNILHFGDDVSTTLFDSTTRLYATPVFPASSTVPSALSSSSSSTSLMYPQFSGAERKQGPSIFNFDTTRKETMPGNMNANTSPIINDNDDPRNPEEELYQSKESLGFEDGTNGQRKYLTSSHLHNQKKRLRIPLNSDNDSDNTWKDRNTYLVLTYDQEFDAHTVFHLEIYWLIATGSQISEWVNRAQKLAKQSDLRFMQIPSHQPDKIGDPFTSTLDISYNTLMNERIGTSNITETNSNVKTIPFFVSLLAQQALLYRFGFVLDTKHSHLLKHYLHPSGCAFVRCRADGFTWVPNTLKHKQYNALKKESVRLFRAFKNYVRGLLWSYDILMQMVESACSTKKSYQVDETKPNKCLNFSYKLKNANVIFASKINKFSV